MKKIFCFLVLSLLIFRSTAQECGTETSSRDFRSLTRGVGRSAKNGTVSVSFKEIPIVFNVLHDEKLLNVTDSAIILAVHDLNAKFNRAKFRFRLVAINRKPLKDFSWYNEYLTAPVNSNSLPSMKGGTGTSKVFEISNSMGVSPATTLNVYVLPRLFSVLGWSYIPPFGATTISPDPKNPDGVWIRTSTFAQNPASYNRNATLIHEVGHYLGLFHTFNGAFSCENFGLDCSTTGDLVCDTPPFKQSAYLPDCTPGCNVVILPSDPWGNYVQDNHMDYLADNCRRNFTDGQISRMHTYTVTNRKNVYSPISDFCLADLDNDGNVNSQDLLVYLSCHGSSFTTGSCYRSDFDGDGIVGVSDQLFLLSMIGQRCD